MPITRPRRYAGKVYIRETAQTPSAKPLYSMKIALKTYSKVVFGIIGGLLLSCNTETEAEIVPSETISTEKVWIDSLESDGISGATALGDMDDIDWNSPLARLKQFLDSNHFIIDTTRLKQLAKYAYQDLRKTPFSKKNRGLVNILNKKDHSMSKSPVLINGEGYYFAKIDENGEYLGIDLGFEFWKIDNSNPKEIAQLELWWKEKYHPMPLFCVVKNDNLYVLYTRSIQFAPFLERCKEIVEK